MPSQEELKAKASAAYNAAADSYDSPVNTFWERFGRRTVERLQLGPGMRVLDVCCGSGASAIAAAEVVGVTGQVIAVDIAEALLVLLRQKVALRGLRQVETRLQDLLELDVEGPGFDAVVCVFGIFFLADMEDAVRRLWRHVRTGGQLAITTWGPRGFEPANSAFWTAVRQERPDLYKGFNPWDTITTPDALEQLLVRAGLPDPVVESEAASHPLASASEWWTIVMGSGYRGTVDQLTEAARQRVREHNIRSLEAEGISAIETNVMYAAARKGTDDLR